MSAGSQRRTGSPPLRGMCVLVLLAGLTLGGLLAAKSTAQSGAFAYSFELKRDIDGRAESLLERALQEAKEKGARLVIMRLDTPGGTVSSMRAMVSAMIAARLPVVVYVAPEGARAASAGLFLTMAGDVAAMAPETNIGSASPLLGGRPGAGGDSGVLRRKVVNDLVAKVRSLAEGHGRNADLAEQMVRKATNVSVNRARRERLIDVVAESEAALVRRLDGFHVKGRKARVLHTAGLRVERFDPAVSADEPAPPGEGNVVFGVGLPGLVAIGMLAAVIGVVLRWLLYGRRRRFFG